MILNTRNIIIYTILFGFIMYILSSVLDSVFITAIPMDEDWCSEGKEIQTGENDYEYVCFEFKNNLQEKIYNYNLSMVKRNRYLLYIKYFIAYIISLITFYTIPKIKGTLIPESGPAIIVSSFMLAIYSAGLAPFLYSIILPAPYKWFPNIFNEINQAIIDDALRKLKSN